MEPFQDLYSLFQLVDEQGEPKDCGREDTVLQEAEFGKEANGCGDSRHQGCACR